MVRHYDWPGSDSLNGAPYGRCVTTDGRTLRIETDGRGATVEIPESRQQTLYGMTVKDSKNVRAELAHRTETYRTNSLNPEERHKVILELITGKAHTVREISGVLHMSRGDISTSLHRLKKRGLADYKRSLDRCRWQAL